METTNVGDVSGKAGGQTDEQAIEKSVASGETVSRDAYEKLLKQRKADRDRIEALERNAREATEKEMIAKEQFKERAELKAKEADEYKSKLERYQMAEKEAKKAQAIANELIKMGVSPDLTQTALKLVDRSLVQLDDDTGVVLGASEAARKFHAEHAALGFFSKQRVGANHAAPMFSPEKEKTLKEMSPFEKAQKLADLKKQQNR